MPEERPHLARALLGKLSGPVPWMLEATVVLEAVAGKAADAEGLVPGDLVHVRLGDIVPADIAVGEGTVRADQSVLTGESAEAEAGPGGTLLVMDGALAVAVLGYGIAAGLPAGQLLPFVLILLVAAVPVALQATFTLATSLGAVGLARAGVLVTHLTAVEEAAAMDLVCTDKTGTLTQNRVRAVRPCRPGGPGAGPTGAAPRGARLRRYGGRAGCVR